MFVPTEDLHIPLSVVQLRVTSELPLIVFGRRHFQKNQVSAERCQGTSYTGFASFFPYRVLSGTFLPIGRSQNSEQDLSENHQQFRSTPDEWSSLCFHHLVNTPLIHSLEYKSREIRKSQTVLISTLLAFSLFVPIGAIWSWRTNWTTLLAALANISASCCDIMYFTVPSEIKFK